MIQAGTYKARATQVLLTQSKTKGTPGIQVNFQIQDEDFAGESIRWDGWLTEKTAERTFESLRYCGWHGDDISVFAGEGVLDGCDMNDVEIVVKMEPYDGPNEEYQGKSFPRVQWVNKSGGRGLNVENAMAKPAAIAFAEKMKGLAVKSRGAAPAAAAPAPTGKPAF